VVTLASREMNTDAGPYEIANSIYSTCQPECATLAQPEGFEGARVAGSTW
jgi:hypothetical protein